MENLTVAQELRQASTRLHDGSVTIFDAAKKRAQSERDYRKALARRILELKGAGMQVTLIGDVARGDCADLKYDRDLAEAVYRASIEALDSIRAQCSALQSILKYYDDTGG